MPDDDARAPLSTLHAWTLVVVATSTMAVSYVDRQAMAALAPTITKDLGIDDAAFGYLSSAFSIAYLLFAPLAGGLIDRFGARRGLVASVLAWSVVAALHALVPGFLILFLLRILLGTAEAPSFPGAAQAVNRALAAPQRSAGFGVLFTGSSIGAAISGYAAPALNEMYGWRAALLLTAAVGLTWIPLWLVVSAGRAKELLRGERNSGIGDGFTSAIAALPELIANKNVLRAMCVVIAAAPVNGLVINWGAKILVAQNGLTQKEVGSFLPWPPLALDVGAVLFGVAMSVMQRSGFLSKWAPPRLLVTLAGLCALSIAGIGFTDTAVETTSLMALAVFGGGALYALTTSDLLRRVPVERVAAAGGALAAAQSLALIVAFPIVGNIVQSTKSYVDVGVALAVVALAGVTAWLVLEPTRANEP
ncbi:MAG TPA: MFS transporter [Myxococcota bacterium]